MGMVTQKAIVAEHIKTITEKRIACVGDGGNDVAMI
jgi:magnesium-transporting ATPase (P-type)